MKSARRKLKRGARPVDFLANLALFLAIWIQIFERDRKAAIDVAVAHVGRQYVGR